jgi:hypothetical protein
VGCSDLTTASKPASLSSWTLSLAIIFSFTDEIN